MADQLAFDFLPQEIEYTVRRSERARSVRVHVDPHDGAVEVVIPKRGRIREADAAVVELRPWIEDRLREAAAVQERIAARRGRLPYLDDSLHVVAQRGRTRVHRRDDVLLVPEGDPRPALERWYRRAARMEIEPRLDEAVATLGHTYGSLRIGGQRTRWGSCSATGAMSFNWRLVLAPEAVLDYVIWHEACHLEVMDHSRRFWRLLERHRPRYRESRRWLDDHGATLVL